MFRALDAGKMVKFGRQLAANRVQEWEDQYIDYA